MKIIKISLLAAALVSPIFATQENLEKVIVTTANKTSQYLQNITSNVDIITNDEIQTRAYKTLNDALKNHSGMGYSQNGGLGQTSSIFVRGFDSKRVLVLIDGIRYNDPTSASGASFEHILLENVDRIEVVKGAQSGIWGSDASAGVINIITKSALKDRTSTTLYAEFGSFNTQTYGLNSSYKNDLFDLVLGFERLSSDSFSAKTANDKSATDFEDDNYENNSANIKLGYYITQKDRVEAYYNYIDSDTDFDGYVMDSNFAYDPIASANDPLANATSTQKLYGLNYQRFEANYSAKIYYNKSDFQRVSKVAPSAYSDGITKFDGSIDESGINGDYKINSDLSVGGGVDYKKSEHKNSIDKSIKNTGAFITITDRIKEDIGDTILNASLRYDDFDSFDNKTTYKIGFKHTPISNKELSFFANYSTGYNAPTLYQLYDAKVGNKKLNPEKTSGYDLGFKYKEFSLTYFDNTIDDLIDYKMTNPTTFEGAYYNIAGDSKLSGVELNYNSVVEDISLAYNLNYTYLKTEDNNGDELPRRAKNSANLSFDYYGIASTHLGANVSYIGDRKKSPYDTNPKKDYDSYTLVDLVAGYDLNDALNIYAKIDNVLDKEYENITGYGVSERAYYLGFRYRVK